MRVILGFNSHWNMTPTDFCLGAMLGHIEECYPSPPTTGCDIVRRMCNNLVHDPYPLGGEPYQSRMLHSTSSQDYPENPCTESNVRATSHGVEPKETAHLRIAVRI